MSRWRLAFVLCALLAVASSVCAQDLEPRAYSNTPVGMNFLIVGFAQSKGGVGVAPAIPVTSGQLEARGPVLAYARSLELWGRSAKFDVVVPYSRLSGTADFAGQPRERQVEGFADPRLRLSINLFGAPALSLKEFSAYRQDLILGASLQVTPPLGQYDREKLANLGANRWSFKPELGVSKVWGRSALEFAAAATYFTDNDDFAVGKRRSQDPIYSLQGHLVYHLRNGVWLALDATYYAGGRTAVNGVPADDRLESSRIGMTVAIPVDRRNSIKLYASKGVHTRVGTDFDVVGAGWQYRWGGGL